MHSNQPRESDFAVAARVSVELRLRAFTEVHAGAPIVDVANGSVSPDNPSPHGANDTNRRPGRTVRDLAPLSFEPETYLACRRGIDL